MDFPLDYDDEGMGMTGWAVTGGSHIPTLAATDSLIHSLDLTPHYDAYPVEQSIGKIFPLIYI